VYNQHFPHILSIPRGDSMKRALLVPVCISVFAWLPLFAQADDAPLGFFSASVGAQRDAEEVFLATPAGAKARRWLFQLTEEPHVAGTPQEKKVAEYVRDKLTELGLEAEMVGYEVFLNHPKHVSLQLVEPVEEPLALMEDAVELDKDSTAHGMFPGFHGYGASGKARGQVVYVNYATPDDFEKLEKLGISAEGRIVLARYGKVFRGLKVREAQNAGAIGVILFSDPADDGYMKGDVYPDGPMRPPSAIQRGSVQYLSLQPGDPSTPGYPSRDGAPRLGRAEMKTVPSIPSLPIAYREAEKILRRLGGPRVPDAWQGGLPFAYHVGPGGAAVAMEVEMDEGLKPIWNVFGRIRGSEEPERLVILGNHRDAWNHGAVDPNSGTAAWLETARGLAKAVKAGWTPKRTVLLASWDAEEYGLVGSVEWGEDRAEDLGAHAVAYVNLDSAVTGDEFGAGGSPSLRDLVRQVAAAVPEPVAGGSVGEAWEKRLRGEWASEAPIDLSEPDAAFELHLPPLGSGSDYTVFLDHLGIPCVNFGFSGSYGVYHSMYDNFRWMDEHRDPTFIYHAAAARFYGLMAMRLSSADVVPMRFGSYAASLRDNLRDLERLSIRKLRGADPEAADEDVADPDAEPAPLKADFAPLYQALKSFEAAGLDLDQAVDDLIDRGEGGKAAATNAALLAVERAFLSSDGLPGRPWFRHLLYAPGTTTGYAPWPFPELAEAVENKDAELFERGMGRLLAVLQAAIGKLEEAAAAAR
jgi:N-acetylated-alpha-linked acidic dipeptidase